MIRPYRSCDWESVWRIIGPVFRAGETCAYALDIAEAEAMDLRLWQKLGFEIIGTVPRGSRHARLGLVDAHILFKSLSGETK